MSILKRFLVYMFFITAVFCVNKISCYADWNYDSKGWWYYDKTVNPVTGWQYIDNKWYYFEPSGYMKTGWLKYQDNWYYFYDNGSMAKDTFIGEYYLDSHGIWNENSLQDKKYSTFIKNNNNINVSDLNNEAVYLSEGDKSYHLNNHCSSMISSNVTKASLKEAEAMGFMRCNNCY